MAEPGKKDPFNIGEILEGLKETTSLGRNLEEAQIWERWPEIAGVDYMAHGRPLGVREGRLIIEVDSAVWMHKFAYRKAELVASVNGLCGRELVTEVYLMLTEEEKLEKPQDDV